jgi:hypothetical protein
MQKEFVPNDNDFGLDDHGSFCVNHDCQAALPNVRTVWIARYYKGQDRTNGTDRLMRNGLTTSS